MSIIGSRILTPLPHAAKLHGIADEADLGDATCAADDAADAPRAIAGDYDDAGCAVDDAQP
jgi:hypothetical protein